MTPSNRTVLAALLAVLLLPPALGAQQAAPYILGPGDVIEVTVFGYADLTRAVVVMPDGRVSLPLVGIIQVAGLTLDRVTQVLIRAYAAFIRNPQVSVTVREFRKISVSILGEVARPGTYMLPPGATLLDIIAVAGGLTEEADLGGAQLLRPGQPPLIVDLQQVMAGDSQANAPLQGGETLIVRADVTSFVNLAGQVSRPGRYRLKGPTRVLDLLLLAGGLTDKASLTEATLVRATGEREPLALDRLLLKQDMSANVLLRPGDTLFIPDDLTSIYFIVGDVRRVGEFPLRGEVTILQALAAAGGVVPRGLATARTAYILRRTESQERYPAGVKVERLPEGGVLLTIDLAAIERGDVSGTIQVQRRDVIVVPESGLSGLSGLQLILSILAGLRNFILPFLPR